MNSKYSIFRIISSLSTAPPTITGLKVVKVDLSKDNNRMVGRRCTLWTKTHSITES